MIIVISENMYKILRKILYERINDEKAQYNDSFVSELHEIVTLFNVLERANK